MAKFQDDKEGWVTPGKLPERPCYEYCPEPVLATNVKPTYAKMRGVGAAIKGTSFNKDA